MKKVVRRSDISKQENVPNKIAMQKSKTPAKKSFPTKMREQINSCKKPKTNKIISTVVEKRKADEYLAKYNNSSKNRFDGKNRAYKDHVKVPNSYYSAEYASKSVVKAQNKAYYGKTTLKDGIKPAPSALEALVSPPKHISEKAKSITRQTKYSRHGARQTMHNQDTPQMGGGSMHRSQLRNSGKSILASKGKNTAFEAVDKDLDMQQVPIKVFDMHGQVRAPMRVEEMQGAGMYRTNMEYQDTNAVQHRRTGSKRLKSREKGSRRSRGKVSGGSNSAGEGYRVNNQMYSQSLPARANPGFGDK